MKRRNYLLLPVILFAAVVLIAAAPRTGSWQETNQRLDDGMRITILSFMADSTGTIAAYETSVTIRGLIYQVVTLPDTTNIAAISDSVRYLTDDYDITLVNGDGIDIMGGALANRDSLLCEMTPPKTTAGTEWPFINNSTLTATVTNNDTPNGRGTIKIYWIQK